MFLFIQMSQLFARCGLRRLQWASRTWSFRFRILSLYELGWYLRLENLLMLNSSRHTWKKTTTLKTSMISDWKRNKNRLWLWRNGKVCSLPLELSLSVCECGFSNYLTERCGSSHVVKVISCCVFRESELREDKDCHSTNKRLLQFNLNSLRLSVPSVWNAAAAAAVRFQSFLSVCNKPGAVVMSTTETEENNEEKM